LKGIFVATSASLLLTSISVHYFLLCHNKFVKGRRGVRGGGKVC